MKHVPKLLFMYSVCVSNVIFTSEACDFSVRPAVKRHAVFLHLQLVPGLHFFSIAVMLFSTDLSWLWLRFHNHLHSTEILQLSMSVSCSCNTTSMRHDHKKNIQLALGSLTAQMITSRTERLVMLTSESFQFSSNGSSGNRKSLRITTIKKISTHPHEQKTSPRQACYMIAKTGMIL